MMSDSVDKHEEPAKVSRRWILKSTASLTAGVVAIGQAQATAMENPTPAPARVAPDHDPVTGEIFDRDRHHHWDTV
jgi:hypothetical protein